MRQSLRKDTCRICENPTLYDFLDLGTMPPANTLIDHSQLSRPESRYPLMISACFECSFAQLRHVVPPSILFTNYLYMSSASKTYLAHFSNLAEHLIGYGRLPTDSLVVDIGSNDGGLLTEFKNRGMRVLGVDPAKNLVNHARANGIDSICGYFTQTLAQSLRNSHGPAHLITATNVFAHIDDIQELLRSISYLLSDKGLFVAQFPYLVDLLATHAADTIYHEHLSYFSVTSLDRLFTKGDLELFKVQRIPIHGGSLRIYARKKRKGTRPKHIERMIRKEQVIGLNRALTYHAFSSAIQRNRDNLLSVLLRLKKQRKRVAGLGAPAKGITLINYLGLDSSFIEYITDSTPSKHGLYTPQSHIRICPEPYLFKHPPDFAIIFVWNFAQEIMEKTRRLAGQGMRYIIPVPRVKVL